MRAAILTLALAFGASAQEIVQIEQASGQDLSVGASGQQTQQPSGQDFSAGASGQQTQQTSGQDLSVAAQSSASSTAPKATGNPNAPPAPITEENPLGTVYKAEMPEKDSNSIRGYVSAAGNTNGTGVVWSVNIENLPKTGGPFAYHVHDKPVPADGNCTGAGPHLDPQGRGEEPPCDLSEGRKTCQVGDLSGKHGKMNQSTWQVFYLDLYTSTTPGSPGFVGNRSIVIHDKEKNRLTCANLTMIAFSSDPSACASGEGSQSTGVKNSDGSKPTDAADSGSATQKGTQPASSADAFPTPSTGAAAHHIAQPATAALGVAALFALAL